METIIFYGIIVLIVLHFLFNAFADFLNDTARKRSIPKNVEDIYDEDSYTKWLHYSSEQNALRNIYGLLVFFFIVLMLINGGFVAVANWSSSVTNNNPYLETLVFIGIFYGLSFIFNLPFSYYNTFSIEERYGFNRATKKTFVTDKIKSVILSIIFGGGFIYLLTWIYVNTGNYFILYAFIAVMIIFLFINMTYTTIFVPLFNKLSPLDEDSDLKQKIEDFAKSQDYEIKKIWVMDASKRSSKLNAFFSGFGKFKNVVLFDTLLKKMDDDQIVSVLAHEIGHAKHKDVIRNMVMSFITFGVLLSLFFGFISIRVFHEAFGLSRVHFGFMLLLFSFVISPITLLVGILGNHLSRKAEYKADMFSAINTSPSHMTGALKILSRENFSQLTPHPLYVFLHYSHPPVSQRIHHITKDNND